MEGGAAKKKSPTLPVTPPAERHWMKRFVEGAVGDTHNVAGTECCESAVCVDQGSHYPLWGQISHALRQLLDTTARLGHLMD